MENFWELNNLIYIDDKINWFGVLSPGNTTGRVSMEGRVST